jgi:hypothetical protein
MPVVKISERGHLEALYGLGLSHGKTSNMSFTDFSNFNELCMDMAKVSRTLAFKGNGHNKFLESMDVWLLVDETRYFWSEADTYRLTTKQSESTMHKQKLEFETFTPESKVEVNFLDMLVRMQQQSAEFFKCAVDNIQGARGIKIAKMGLLESLQQKRVWKVSYMTLQNIVRQRENHRLDNWKEFCKELKKQLDHPELVFKGVNDEYK